MVLDELRTSIHPEVLLSWNLGAGLPCTRGKPAMSSKMLHLHSFIILFLIYINILILEDV